MDPLDVTGIVNTIVAQSPLVAFCVTALYFTRKDLAETKAENKDLVKKLFDLTSMVIAVVEKNTQTIATLSEKIDDIT